MEKLDAHEIVATNGGRRRPRTIGYWRLAAVVALVAAVGCGSWGTEPGPVTLKFGGFSAVREVYEQALIPAFQEHWRRESGQEVHFEQTYDASGALARGVAGGLEADVVALSHEGDVDVLKGAGKVLERSSRPYTGAVVSSSVVVIAVRPGNPHGIRDWVDLARPGLRVLTPDPRTSGGGRWNVAAVYGAALRGTEGSRKFDRAEAGRFLEGVLRNVTDMDKSARDSMLKFWDGVGDAAITYESEALAGRRAGREIDYVVPPSTLLVENPVVVVDAEADRRRTRRVAEAFAEFLLSDAAQRAFVDYGLRPVEPGALRDAADRFPPVQDLWPIGALRGWRNASEELFGLDGAYTRAFEAIHAAE